MSTTQATPWVRRAGVVLLVLVVLSPVFAWGAEAVGYAEPLENAAEATGATADEQPLSTGVFPDYTIPGLDGPLTTLVAAAIGTALTLVVGVGAGRALE